MDIQELSDRMEIRDLITTYTRAVDTSNWDGIEAVFAPGAILDYTSAGGPVAGIEEAKEFIKNLAGFDRWQHLIGQIEIVLEGDSARATAYFTNPMVSVNPDGSEKLWEVGGYYHHELVRRPEGWRSLRLVDEMVWARGN